MIKLIFQKLFNTMKNTTIIVAVFILVLGGVAFFVIQENSNNSKLIVQDSSAQEITLSMKNYNYYPNTIKVEAGKLVTITLDNSVKGCYRSFTINDLGVRKYSASPEEKITFTPNKKGTFRFACSMGMGYGTIIVK